MLRTAVFIVAIVAALGAAAFAYQRYGSGDLSRAVDNRESPGLSQGY